MCALALPEVLTPPQEFQSRASDIVIRAANGSSVKNERGYHGGITARMDNS
jgi:hypothetical protein